MEDYAMLFAENLRRFRKHLKMTQEQLGERLGYTEKAVSKWEGGNSIPPAETLILLADALNVSLDDLFGHSSQADYYLGIDGGATKTTFALADRQGNILQKIVLGPSNPFDLGFAAAAAIIEQGINQITSHMHRRKIAMFAGISGGGMHEMRERFKMLFASYGFLRADNGSDALNIIAAGLKGSDGIIVIMGTGISCFVSCNGEITRLGGLGYLFDRGGSGYNLGNDAIYAACCDEDGTGERTLITRLLCEECKSAPLSKNIFQFYNAGKTGIASFAPVVFEAYAQGDKVAEEILDRNMKSVASLIASAGRCFGDKTSPIKVSFVGGLTKQWDVLFPMISRHLEEIEAEKDFDINVFDGDVVVGALACAGMPIDGKTINCKQLFAD